MIIILDLDYTLLDTERFKEALESVFSGCGINRARFMESYRQTAEHSPPDYDYDANRHIEILSREVSCSSDDFRHRVEEVVKSSADYLYSGAGEFILELREMGFQIILLTLGNTDWQKDKVENSGLANLFDDVIFVSSNKESALSQFSNAEKPIFVVNDNCNEVMAMKMIRPDFNYIVKRGPKGVDSRVGVPVVNTFEEVLKQIRQISS